MVGRGSAPFSPVSHETQPNGAHDEARLLNEFFFNRLVRGVVYVDPASGEGPLIVIPFPRKQHLSLVKQYPPAANLGGRIPSLVVVRNEEALRRGIKEGSDRVG